MGHQTGKNMMRILPNRLHHDQWGIGRQISEYLHPVLLGIDESVLLYRIVSVTPRGSELIALDRRGD
jgi:hypothetical protein